MAAQFYNLVNCALDKDSSGNIYTVDSAYTSPIFLRKLDQSGNLTTIASFPYNGGGQIAVDSLGNIYTTAYLVVEGEGSWRIGVINQAGNFTAITPDISQITGFTDSRNFVEYIYDFKFRSDGFLYVVTGGANVYKMDSQGVVTLFTTITADPVAKITCLQFDSNNNILLGEFDYTGRIFKTDPLGALVSTLATARQIFCFALDDSNNIYIPIGAAVYRFDTSNTETVIAGTPLQPGFADGTSALFSWQTWGVVVVNGNIYVSDATNLRIREIVYSDGVYTTYTVAGDGTQGRIDGTGTIINPLPSGGGGGGGGGDPVLTTMYIVNSDAQVVVDAGLEILVKLFDQFSQGLTGQQVYLENTGSSTPGASTLMENFEGGTYKLTVNNSTVESVTYTATIGSFTDTLNISWIAAGGGGGGGGGAPCFLEGTRILCKEGYLPVETLVPGTLVKTSLNGYKKIVLIGSGLMENPDNEERLEQRLYKLSTSNYPELEEDLFITGCHSRLVRELTDKEKEETEKHIERVFVTDKQYRLMACVDKKAEPWNSKGQYTIWHFALENEDIKMNYGVYANGGLLVETCCLDTLENKSRFTLIK